MQKPRSLPLANPLPSVYAPPVGACRPTWPRAFVRFTENKVAGTRSLSDILTGFGQERGPVGFFQSSALSETAGAGCRLNRPACIDG
jgi:hypothetical protein